MKTQKLLLCCFKPVSLVTFSKCYCWPPGCLGCQLYIYLWEFFFPPLPNLIYLTLQNTNRTGHFSPPLHLLFLHQPCLDLPTGLPASFHPSPRSLSTQCSFQNLGGFASIRNHQRRLKSLGNSLADSKPPLTRGKTDFHKWKKKKKWKLSQGMKVNKRLTTHTSCCDTLRRQACHPDSRLLQKPMLQSTLEGTSTVQWGKTVPSTE